MMKHRRIDIFGHQTSLALEPEYWDWLYEIAAKIGVTLKDIIEATAATRDYNRSLASEIRCAVAAYFHGNPYPICRCPVGMVPMRDGSLLLGWPGGRRRAQDGPRSMLVDQAHGTRKPRPASRSASRFRQPDGAR
jgi:predicted DNA-binding ribbon-helix-helix protein